MSIRISDVKGLTDSIEFKLKCAVISVNQLREYPENGEGFLYDVIFQTDQIFLLLDTLRNLR